MDCADEVVTGLSRHNFAGSPFYTEERTTSQGERVLDREPLHCHTWTYDPIFPRSGE